MRRLLPLTALALIAAAPAITETQVRALIARQQRAWNAGDLTGWARTYAPDARFTDQARSNENTIIPYGTSTLAQAKAQAGRVRGRAAERGQVRQVWVAPDGRTARVSADIVTRLERRTSCAERMETFALTRGRLLATAQTDTVVRCRR